MSSVVRPLHLPPPGHPTLQVYVDESGVANQSRYFALGALVFRRDHGIVTNEIAVLRDQAEWRKEAHFVEVNRTTAHLYRAAVDIVARSDGRFVCAVVDKDEWNPLASRRDAWKTHAQLTIQLLGAVVGKGHPILSVLVDHLTTPAAVNYEGYVATAINRTQGYVATAVNRTQGYLAIAGVNRMDSRSCIGLQLADILTGAVAHQYRQDKDPTARAGSPKGQVAAHVAQAWNLSSLVGAGSPRFKVVELSKPRRRRPVASVAEAAERSRTRGAKLNPPG